MYTGRVESCSKRLYEALSIRGMKQAELCTRTKIPKSSMSLYLSGAYEPKQDRLYIIAEVLDIDPVWLMGYDVPMERDNKEPPDKVELTEGEKVWLELYHRLSSETREILIKMADAFERMPNDEQISLLGKTRADSNNQKSY